MELERELYGPHSFQSVAETHSFAETHSTYVLYHLGFHFRTWNTIPATSLAKSQNIHLNRWLMRGGQDINLLGRRKGVLRSYVWVSCFLTILLIPGKEFYSGRIAVEHDY